MKLLTTFAALELLGPAWTWNTPVWLQGTVKEGVLDGNLVIKGSGDPKLVLERMWLLLRRVQQLGVREIRGDIVLDRSAFVVPEQAPADFDGEPLRPYNVRADALLLNYKSLVFTLVPDASRGLALIASDPPLAGVRVDASVPLVAGPCEDWRAALRPDLSDPTSVRFAGSFALACGEKVWPLAYADPNSFNERALLGLWQAMGGRLIGTVRDGLAPAAPPTYSLISPALAEVVRDINKFSNNVMAQQLFLTLALAQRGSGTPELAREVLGQWAAARLGGAAEALVVDNGSGLSRDGRVSASLLERLLLHAWASPVMPELMASLPVSGVDGTLKRSRATLGRAHLKTGSLRDVSGVAGYVLANSGRRYAVVAIVNHANANAARPAFDALVQWVANDAALAIAPAEVRR
jgi:D-alanyl-D-alanine carboxypeptidase/D-alanyl-D-alanine-endopeptidase (penicillin-binding protein 4)